MALISLPHVDIPTFRLAAGCGIIFNKMESGDGNMKKLLLSICSAAVVLGAEAAVSSRSYVQRGLAAQYDGINNVGHDVAHNSSATVWKDLTGNGNDGTCASLLSWSADGWSVSGDCKPVTIPAPGLAATMGTREFTIQFACTPAMDNKREAFFSQYNYTSAPGGFGLEHNNGGDFTGKLRYYKFTSRTGSDYLDYLTNARIPSNTFTSASVAVSPTVQKCWLNGTLSDTRNGSISRVSRSCQSVIGGEPQVQGARPGDTYTAGYGITFQGKYNAFRLYDRPLSEDEAKVNAAVDAIRFNGANPGDFALTGGWSFDGTGDLCVDVTATASGNGTVSVNGGGASATVKQYATVTFSATPGSGSVFCRWEGDTHAIVSGSVITPSIEVSSADPVLLVAVFKVPSQGARSYIHRGLVANFDGIDNAGTGMHDSSATTWVDLTGNGNDATKGSNASWNGTDGWTSSTDGQPMTIPEGNGAETTIAGATVDKVFSVQFAVKPSRHTVRQCFFGQWDKYGVSIEHNGGNSTMDGHLRAFYNYTPGNIPVVDDIFTQVLVTSGEWATMSFVSDTAQQTVWKNGETSQTFVRSLTGAFTNRCPTVIGGDNARTAMGFRGTYNALRLYNRVLSEEEVKVNAAIDDRRFNGGAKGLAFPAGWSFVDNMLMVNVSVTATEGGKISYRGGAAAQSITDTVNHDGSKVLAFAAVPDAGYVFERWSGDTDLITVGSTLAREIIVDPDRPVTFVAKFRRNGDAADGKIFDLSFTGDATADGMTFSDTVAEDKQGYVTADIALPVLPTVTNANVSCLYLPQPANDAGTGTYWQMAVSDKPAVTGDVATVFVRFRWDGPVIPNIDNYSAMFHNGYNGWTSIGQGFLIRLFSKANSTDAYLSLLVGGRDLYGEIDAIEDVSGTGFVKPGEWVDVFVSVYPSPTDSTLSNADIWYCRPPTWNSGGWFNVSTIGHRHFGDAAKIPHMDSTTTLLRAGCESAPSASAVMTGANATKVFRGAIAAAKGWNRLLSESERWTVMAEFDGVQSFGDRHSFNTGTLTTQEGHNGTATAFVGDAVTAHFWRAMHKAYPSLTLVWNAPKDKPAQPVTYRTVIANTKSGNTQPVHLEVNGTTVWSSDNVARGDKICVEIDAAHTLPGLNELKWVYDTDVAGNYITFEYHKLKIGETGMTFIIK